MITLLKLGMDTSAISSDFPFESHFAEVHGSRMHYIEEGMGDPVLFLHGNPTSSYLWRNIIPWVSGKRRCIAPDLIGMGLSDKPKLQYKFEDHYRYVSGFIEKMELRDITLVVHDWGSGLGFHYASLHPENIKGIAFMEVLLFPASWKHFPRDFKMGFKLMRTPYVGWFLISVMNVFIKQILPQATHRTLTDEEMEAYKTPFPTIASRKPLREFPREIPIDGKPARMQKIVSEYGQKIQKSTYPKLLLYANPGGLVTAREVEWCKTHLKNLTTVDLGPGIHFVQEDHPHEIGKAVAEWLP
jgi:haloalkane dehalogenase